MVDEAADSLTDDDAEVLADTAVVQAAPDGRAPHVVIVTGLSGGGKRPSASCWKTWATPSSITCPSSWCGAWPSWSPTIRTALSALRWSSTLAPATRRLAFAAAVGALEGRGIKPQVFFLEASDEVIIRRFSETRHRHPLETTDGVAASIERERELLEGVRGQADVIIDTTDLSTRQLRERVYSALGGGSAERDIAVNLISFGYKHGIPLEADLVFDVRFMENPFYNDELRPLSGLTEEVRRFVLDKPQTQQFLAFLHDFLAFALPAYQSEGKAG